MRRSRSYGPIGPAYLAARCRSTLAVSGRTSRRRLARAPGRTEAPHPSEKGRRSTSRPTEPGGGSPSGPTPARIFDLDSNGPVYLALVFAGGEYRSAWREIASQETARMRAATGSSAESSGRTPGPGGAEAEVARSRRGPRGTLEASCRGRHAAGREGTGQAAPATRSAAPARAGRPPPASDVTGRRARPKRSRHVPQGAGRRPLTRARER